MAPIIHRMNDRVTFHPPPFLPASFLFLCLNALFLGYLRIADLQLHNALVREDNLFETLTAVWLLLTGVLLLVIARQEKNRSLRQVWILAGLVFLFGAGEEVSWGQRILGLATPDFLLGLNQQNELNVHNIHSEAFGSLYWNGTYFLCILTSAAHFCRRTSIRGIPLPSMPLVLGLLVTKAPYSMNPADLPHFFVSAGKGLILLLVCYALLARRRPLFIAAATTAAVVLALSYTHLHRSTAPQEAREYLACMGFFFWSLEILRTRGGLKTLLDRPFLQPGAARRLRLRPGVDALALIALGLGLMPFMWYHNNRIELSLTEKSNRVIIMEEPGEPLSRSRFNIWLNENRLIYVREPCVPDDIAEPFFLHLTPARAEDLPVQRRWSGFDNHDFYFGRHGTVSEEGCTAIVPLPEYPVARIHTGQFIAGTGRRLWEAEFSLDRDTRQAGGAGLSRGLMAP